MAISSGNIIFILVSVTLIQIQEVEASTATSGLTADTNEAPYRLAGQGVAKPGERWNVGGAKGKGVQACYEAVMADSKCAKDFFTYVPRGDKNCGCKGSSGKLQVRGAGVADYYQIQAKVLPTWTASSPYKVCNDPNNARTFQGTGKTLDECKGLCLSQPGCRAIYGALGYGDGSCWTFPGQCTETKHVHNYKVYHVQAKPTSKPKSEDASAVDWPDLSGLKARQSSTGWGGSASKAIDGNAGTRYGGRSCTHTRGRPNPGWWEVDLGATRSIRAVSVTNRGDCCGSRLNGFSVLVDGKKCATGVSISQGETKVVPCNGNGNTVRIQGPKGMFTLCEVKVGMAKVGAGASTSDSKTTATLESIGYEYSYANQPPGCCGGYYDDPGNKILNDNSMPGSISKTNTIATQQKQNIFPIILSLDQPAMVSEVEVSYIVKARWAKRAPKSMTFSGGDSGSLTADGFAANDGGHKKRIQGFGTWGCIQRLRLDSVTVDGDANRYTSLLSEIRVLGSDCEGKGKEPTKKPTARYASVKKGFECKSGDSYMGKTSSAAECAGAVKAAGGSYFIFGTGSKKGKCYKENTASVTCSEGWESDSYDFYMIQGDATCDGFSCKAGFKSKGKDVNCTGDLAASCEAALCCEEKWFSKQPSTNCTSSNGVCSKGTWGAYFGRKSHAQCKAICDGYRVLETKPDPQASTGGWVRIFKQTAPTFKRAADWLKSFGEDGDPSFSRLATLGNYKSADGKFHLKIIWPQRSGKNYNEWKQRSNPVNKEKISGYEGIDINFKGNYWGGLEYDGRNCALDGSVNHGNWWYAIGTSRSFHGGFPGADRAEKEVELWVKDPKPQTTKAPSQVGGSKKLYLPSTGLDGGNGLCAAFSHGHVTDGSGDCIIYSECQAMDNSPTAEVCADKESFKWLQAPGEMSTCLYPDFVDEE